MSEWQPIETAPKDGRLILIIREYDNAVTVGKSYQEWDLWQDLLTGVADCYGGVDYDYVHATHWMPLPEPPRSET